MCSTKVVAHAYLISFKYIECWSVREGIRRSMVICRVYRVCEETRNSLIIACLNSVSSASIRGVSPSASAKWMSAPCSIRTKHTALEPLEGGKEEAWCTCDCVRLMSIINNTLDCTCTLHLRTLQ